MKSDPVKSNPKPVKLDSYSLDIKETIRRLQNELRILHKKQRRIRHKIDHPEETLQGCIEDKRRLMTLFCTLRAHGRGKLHSKHMTFEEQEDLIDTLMSLHVAEFIDVTNKVPTDTYGYPWCQKQIVNYKKSGRTLAQLLIMYFDCSLKRRSAGMLGWLKH